MRLNVLLHELFEPSCLDRDIVVYSTVFRDVQGVLPPQVHLPSHAVQPPLELGIRVSRDDPFVELEHGGDLPRSHLLGTRHYALVQAATEDCWAGQHRRLHVVCRGLHFLREEVNRRIKILCASIFRSKRLIFLG